MADLRAALARLAAVVAEAGGKQNISAKIKGNLAGAEAEIKTRVAALLRDNSAKDQDADSAKQEISKLKEEIKKSLLRKNADASNDDEDDDDDDDNNDAAFMLADVGAYNTLTATVDSLQTEVDSLRTKVSTLEDNDKKLRNAMRHKDVQARAAKADVNKTKKDLASSKDELVDKGFEHEEDLKEQKLEAKDHQALIGRMQHSAKVQDARILDLNSQLHKSKVELTGIRDTLARRDRAITYWEKKLPVKEKEVERLEEQKVTTTEEHKATVDDLEERRTKLIAEKGRLAEESEETIGLMKTELDKVKGEKRNLGEELKTAKEDLEESESTNAMLWKRVAKFEGAGAGADGESPASKRARTEGS